MEIKEREKSSMNFYFYLLLFFIVFQVKLFPFSPHHTPAWIFKAWLEPNIPTNSRKANTPGKNSCSPRYHYPKWNLNSSRVSAIFSQWWKSEWGNSFPQSMAVSCLSNTPPMWGSPRVEGLVHSESNNLQTKEHSYMLNIKRLHQLFIIIMWIEFCY